MEPTKIAALGQSPVFEIHRLERSRGPMSTITRPHSSAIGAANRPYRYSPPRQRSSQTTELDRERPASTLADESVAAPDVRLSDPPPDVVQEVVVVGNDSKAQGQPLAAA